MGIIFFKNLFHQARPFWAYEAIKAYDCSTAFGNPSGHAFCVAYFVPYMFFRFFNRKLNTDDKSLLKTFALGFMAFFGFSCIVFMCYSRVILGMHAIN